MRKRKNGGRRYWHWLKRGIVSLVVGVILILSTPTLYAFITYYHVPEAKIDQDYYVGYWETTDSLCMTTYLGGGYILMPQILTHKLVIDDKVIPFYEIHLIDVQGSNWMDRGWPADDYVCTSQPNLDVGEHEVSLFYYGMFQWFPRKRAVFYVDETGNITQEN